MKFVQTAFGHPYGKVQKLLAFADDLGGIDTLMQTILDYKIEKAQAKLDHLHRIKKGLG